MFHYSPLSRSQGYTSYLPRRTYFPASFDIDDAPSSAYDLEDLGYPSLSHSFLPPRIDPETRYRRAVHELEAAEQEYQAHIGLERARRAAGIRQRAAAEAVRREREIALYTEIERINRARSLQEQAEERLAQRQRALRTHVGFDRACRGRDAVMRAIYGGAEKGSVPQGHAARPQADNETLTIGDLLGLFSGVDPQRERASPPQRATSPASSQPDHPADFHPHTESQRPKHKNAEFNLSNILEFFHNIVAEARGEDGGEQSTHEQTLPSQPEVTAIEGKGKGKAEAQPVAEPTLFETLFRERVSASHDQELRDIEHAIKLSLQDRDTSDVEKAHASKASRSSPSASSSKMQVKVEDPCSSDGAVSHAPSVSASVPEPVSPLTSIRAVRTQFSALESAFKFPPILDFEHSELAVTSNNAPVRAYEYALNGLLERLDAIESDGNEEVRDVRRDVVREVERALEEVERKINEQAHQAPVPEVTKQEAGNVESEDTGPSATQAISPAVVHVTEAAKVTLPNLAPVASQADANIDVAISREYESGSPDATPSGVVVGEQDRAAGAARVNGETSIPSGGDTEAVAASEDASDSIATITPASVARAVPESSSSNESAETFLTSLSHDQFTFPPRTAFSQSSTNSEVPHEDDAVLVDNSSEGGSMRSVEDEWATEFDS